MSGLNFSFERPQSDRFWGFSSVGLMGLYAALRILDAYSTLPVVSVEDGGEDVPVIISFQFVFLFWSLICRSIDQVEQSPDSVGQVSVRSLPTSAISLVSLQLFFVACSVLLRHDFLRVIGLVCGAMIRLCSLCPSGPLPDESESDIGARILVDHSNDYGGVSTAHDAADDRMSCLDGFKDHLYTAFAVLILISEAVRDQPDLLALAAALNVESLFSFVRMLREGGDNPVSSGNGGYSDIAVVVTK